MNNYNSDKLKYEGYCIISDLISPHQIQSLNTHLTDSFKKHRLFQIFNNNGITTEGVAQHIILDHSYFLYFLQV